MQYANETISTKVLHAAKQSLGELINGTAELFGAFKALQQVAEETGMPLDSQIMNDCEQMFITINRLMYEQKSRLQHMQMMQVAAEKAGSAVSSMRRGGHPLSRRPNPHCSTRLSKEGRIW